MKKSEKKSYLNKLMNEKKKIQETLLKFTTNLRFLEEEHKYLEELKKKNEILNFYDERKYS